jgi:hypothetical protein
VVALARCTYRSTLIRRLRTQATPHYFPGCRKREFVLDSRRTKDEYIEVLFDLPGPPKLVGIARLADAAALLAAKGDVGCVDLRACSVLNRCASPRMPFAWTINPYRGCEFGGHYCYARYTHELMGMEDGRLFS